MKISSFTGEETGIKSVTYTANGYDIKVSEMFGEKQVRFTGIKGVYQPNIVLNGSDQPYLEFNGSVFISNVEEFNAQVLQAKELALYVKDHLDEL